MLCEWQRNRPCNEETRKKEKKKGVKDSRERIKGQIKQYVWNKEKWTGKNGKIAKNEML